ncbi:class I SAM-dependent methyltransferase [Niastella sp. OAS944]|uniref:class I SAM-dependent methyltransferase n=1 Tax=Niastella sp. OAS944 TaxID=2664089 RepID=UPI00346EBAA0|nr:phospholipid N-methyltransferase [Chitinophagaceae bacterium OAS944]
MQLTEAILLIQKGIVPQSSPQTWADLGAGKGLFSEALLSLLIPGSVIHAIDVQKRSNTGHNSSIIFHQADFVNDKLPIPTLDGILMANSLHYVQDQVACIQKLKTHLRNRTGVMVLIEYDTDAGNEWVPYPVSFARAQAIFSDAGFSSIEKIGERPSVYGRNSMYAALVTQ